MRQSRKSLKFIIAILGTALAAALIALAIMLLRDAGGPSEVAIGDYIYDDANDALPPIKIVGGMVQYQKGAGEWIDLVTLEQLFEEYGGDIGAVTPSATPAHGTPTPNGAASPSPSPSASPTPTATVKASPTPTPKQTATAKPTATATAKPTASATVKPTASATVQPTVSATVKPTASATVKPTEAATPKPTATATPQPTATPVPPTPSPSQGGGDGEDIDPSPGNSDWGGTMP